MFRSILLLGSNLGDREELLLAASEQIQKRAGDILEVSSIYETEPWGFEAENSFLNQVVVIETKRDPKELLAIILGIEEDFGRKRITTNFESRLIDIDILFYDDLIFKDENLIIPHPRIQERMFVLKPLMDISSTMIHPVLRKSISELYEDCEDKMKVEVY